MNWLTSLLPKRFVVTEEHRYCLELLEKTNENIFITGKAGTGKTSLIDHFRKTTQKKVIVVAPTGIAALHIKGQTIHSFFKFPPRMITKSSIREVKQSRLYRDMDLLIIDEISMVRADMLDNIDQFLRLNGKDKNAPFGGIQLVFVGDLYQLPPIVSIEERELYDRLYETPYFFSATSYKETPFHTIELQKVFRQKEQEFITILNKIRVGDVSSSLLETINARVDEKGVIRNHILLCTTNKAAESVNTNKLLFLPGMIYTYEAHIEGDFPTEERNLPVELSLQLKKNARVLFVKNDPGGQWVNGSVGTVSRLDADHIVVRLDESGLEVEVTKMDWEQIRYTYNETTGEIENQVLGTLTQYPLKLAWAITIHKSQGMSFNNAVIDFRKSPFAHGQTYVALSRCRSLQGLILTKKIWPNDILVDDRIIEFFRTQQRAS